MTGHRQIYNTRQVILRAVAGERVRSHRLPIKPSDSKPDSDRRYCCYRPSPLPFDVGRTFRYGCRKSFTVAFITRGGRLRKSYCDPGDTLHGKCIFTKPAAISEPYLSGKPYIQDIDPSMLRTDPRTFCTCAYASECSERASSHTSSWTLHPTTPEPW